MNGKISQKNRKIHSSYFAVRLASFCLAVCVSILAFGRSVEAAGRVYTVGSVANGDWSLYYNQHGQNFAPDQILSSNNIGTRAIYKVPLQLSVRNSNAGYGQYATGVLTWNVYWTPDTSIDNGAGEWSFDLEYPIFEGEGFSWSFRPHGVRSGTIIVILDNYQCNTYGVPGPDWNLLFNVVSQSAPTWGLGYNAYTFMATVTSGNVDLTNSSTGSLSSAIAGAINSSTDIDSIVSILNAIKSDTTLLVDVAAQLDTTNTALGQIVSNITEENSAFYWLLVNAIKNANDSQAPVVKDEVVQDMENIGSSMDNGHDVEQGLVDDMDTSISNIDFNFISSAPTTVAGAAPWVVGLIYNIWSYMGPLQYLMTCALTLGLAFVLMAEINKKNKS